MAMIQQLKFLARPILIKSAIIFGLLVAIYLGYMKYSEYRGQQQLTLLKHVSELRMNLVQSRASWVTLAKLDPESSDLNLRKTNIISQINRSIVEGKKLIELERICTQQQEVLDELLTKKTFDEGMNYLHSDKVVGLITDMTNLIYKYEYEEGRIREQLRLNP